MPEANASINDNESSADPGHPLPGDEAGTASQADKLVPVSEAIRYRKRAQSAEQQLENLNGQVRELNHRLDEANQQISGLEHRQRIDALLMEADVIDLDAARLLTERVVVEMEEPDPKQAVEDMRRHKPYLFRRRAHADPSAMSPSVPSHGQEPAEIAAQEAARTGDRRDLLRYLRLRRSR